MHESDTYLAILEEGALNHARKMVLRVGQKKFGPASDDVVTAVKGIEDLERLDRLQEDSEGVQLAGVVAVALSREGILTGNERGPCSRSTRHARIRYLSRHPRRG